MPIYPARGSAEALTHSAYGAPGHLHPGYVQHVLDNIEPQNPVPGMLWTTGGSQRLPWVSISSGGQTLSDFPGYDDDLAEFDVSFTLPSDSQETLSAVVTVVASVTPVVEGSSDLTPFPVLTLAPTTSPVNFVPLTLDPSEAIVANTYDVAVPGSWLAAMEQSWSLRVGYDAEGGRVEIIDITVLLVRNGVTYSYDGAQWTVFSTAGEVIASHNELAGRSSPDTHPIGAITGLQDTLDTKLVANNIVAGPNIAVSTLGNYVTITGLDPVVDHGELLGLADDDHPQYLDATRGYPRSIADQVFVNVIGDTMTGDLDVEGRVRTNDLQVRSADASHSAIEFATNAGERRAEISADTDVVEFRAIDGSIMAEVKVGRLEAKGMINVQPAGVSNELSITAGEGQPDNTVIIDGLGFYADVSQGTGLWITTIPGDNTTWEQIGGAGTHHHDDDYVQIAQHGSADHATLVSQLAPVSHLTSAESAQGAGDLLHVQYPTIQPSDLGLSSSIGVSDTLARADHVHARPTLGELNAAAAAHDHSHTDITDLASAYAAKEHDSDHDDRFYTKTFIDDALATKENAGHTHAYVPTSRNIGAGAGLTGGGSLTADRTLSIGAGTGITVNANDIAVNRTIVDAWYEPIGEVTSQLSTHTTPGTTPDPHTQYQLESEKGAANGYAPLGADSKVPSVNLPVARTTNYFQVATVTARKTATSYNPDGLYKGDTVFQASNATSWVYTGDTEPADQTAVSNDANWFQQSAGGVTSVNGDPGPAVVLAAADVGAPPTSRTITAGSGLTGGGSLASNRTINVGAGTGISVAANSVAVDRAQTDSWYSLSGHNHDSDYAPQGHDHDSSYAPGKTFDARQTVWGTVGGALVATYGEVSTNSNLMLGMHNELFNWGLNGGYVVTVTSSDNATASGVGNSISPRFGYMTLDPNGGPAGQTVEILIERGTAPALGTRSHAYWSFFVYTRQYYWDVDVRYEVRGDDNATWTQVYDSAAGDSPMASGVVHLSQDTRISTDEGGYPPSAVRVTFTLNNTTSRRYINEIGVYHENAPLGDSVFSYQDHLHDDRYYTEAESDSRFINVNGDTMSGELRITDDFSASGMVRSGSDPVNFSSKPGAIWIREDDDTGTADPIFDPANYAGVDHDHQGIYSPVGHTHTGDFASSGHKHDLDYSRIGHDHTDFISSTGDDVTGDYNIDGMLSVSGLVRTSDPSPLVPGQLWIDTDDPGTTLGDPAQHVHDDIYDRAQQIRLVQGPERAGSWITMPDLDWEPLDISPADWTFIAPYPGLLRVRLTFSIGSQNRDSAQRTNFWLEFAASGSHLTFPSGQGRHYNGRASAGNHDEPLAAEADIWLDAGASARPVLIVQNQRLGSNNQSYNYVRANGVFLPSTSAVVDTM